MNVVYATGIAETTSFRSLQDTQCLTRTYMKTVLIAGMDDLIYNAADLLNPAEMKLVGFATTDSGAWNVLNEDGSVKEIIEEMPVMPIDLAAGYNPDIIIAAAKEEEKNTALKYMIYRSGFQNEVIFLYDTVSSFSARTALFRRLAWRLNVLGIAGSIAELGCGNGDSSWQLNALFPTRKLFLFDTFEGFDPRDIEKEKEYSDAAVSEQAAVYSPERLMERMPEKDMVTILKGWFPHTAESLEDETFAFVYIDPCLYQPAYTGLQFFLPRLTRGGMILLGGYEDPRFTGIRKAVEDIEEKYGALLIVPAQDLNGSVVIIKP